MRSYFSEISMYTNTPVFDTIALAWIRFFSFDCFNICAVCCLHTDVSLSDSLIDTKLPSILSSLVSQCAAKDDLPFTEPLIEILSTFIEKGMCKTKSFLYML